MKFTNGFWLVRDEYEPTYAVEYFDHSVDQDVLTVFASTMHVSGRGDLMNHPMLTIEISSPMNDVIKVSITHFKGTPNRGPEFEKHSQEHVDISIEDSEEFLRYTSGSTSVVIDKRENSWAMSYYSEDRLLTESSFRNQAYMHNRNTGKNYMLE